MKQKTIRKRIIKIAIVASTILLLAPLTILYSFRSKLETYNDFWQQLGISEKNGTGKIKQSFLYGYLQYYGVKNFKNIATADRKSVTTDLLNYTKNYVQGNEFKTAYAAERENLKPREVTKKPKTEDEIRQELIAGAQEGMTNLEKSIKNATGEMKKVFEDSYEMLKQQMADYKKPDNQMIPLMAQGEKSQYENELKRYADDVKKWEQNYPADASKFVKLRLQEVLKVTAGIDYGAALVEKNNKKYFVKKEYEGKDSNWKAGFRAGRDVTETMRSFVQQWISEL